MSTNDTTTQNLLFLLAAAPLGLGCIIVTDDGNDTEAGTSSPTTGGPTTGATGTDTTPGTGEGTGEGDGTGGSTAAEGSTGADSTGGADSTTGGVSGSACADYGAHAVKCQVPYADYLSESCYYNLDYQEYTSDECGVAFLEYVACLSELSCEELMGDAPCQAELDALLAMGCPTVEF